MTCQGCNRTDVDFYPRHKALCKKCYSATRKVYSREYHAAHREERNAKNRQRQRADKIGTSRRTKAYRDRIRSQILAAYGGCCKCCGENQPVFLAIDHVNNDGASERKVKNKKRIYLDIVEENFPDRYQLLCHNCNWAKQALGSCPHNATAA